MNAKDVEVNYQVMSQKDLKNDLSISNEDIERTIAHLEKVKEIVSKVMRKDIDFGTIPGTPKPTLLKPGAEKLLKIFGLGFRCFMTDKEVDRYENFASYTYKGEVYHLKTGLVIAECEATTSSWEKKYKTRIVYVDRVATGTEPTPINDISNTLMKMAQKRCLVGATLIATAASDYFTQDPEDIGANGPQYKTAQKTDGSKFETKGGAKDPSDYVAKVAKYKGKRIGDIDKKELAGYVASLTESNPNIDGPLKEFINTAREYIRASV